MTRRPVVLGWPISLMLRGIGGFPSAGALGVATVVGAGVGAGLAVSAQSVLEGTAPWASTTTTREVDSYTGSPGIIGALSDAASLATDFLGGVLTFFDMNAEVARIRERRRIARVSIPGRESDFLQDLGGHTTMYSVSGRFYDTDPQYLTHRSIMQTILKTTIGSAAVGSTQVLRLIMRTRSPVPFISEHEISFAVISDFDVTQTGGEPEWARYNMNLLEYRRIPYVAKMAILGTGNFLSRELG